MQPFWLSLLRDVLNVSEPEKLIRFEVPVKLKHTSFIDAFLPDTKVIIEQKSLSGNLEQGKSQSDGSILTPYEQAQRYGSSLPYSMRPRWIIVCNFAEFLIYDMETLAAPTKILLSELPEKVHTFDFLIDNTKTKSRVELELSLKAGEIVGKLYDALRGQYLNPDNEDSLASLNKLCVRLVFCLYAESAGIFGKHKIFRDWLSDSRNIRWDLINLDYVAGWYKKAADFCRGKNIRAAFVSTNSICQGDSVATLWRPLFNDGIHIDFAHRTFRWDSESAQKAHVHCVIVGFSSASNDKPKIIFDGGKKITAANINAYLLDADNIFVESRPNHLQDFVPAIGIGNKPIDDGNYLFTPDEMNDFIAREPASEKYFRKWYGAREFINNDPRYCLLLKDCPPNELKRMPLVYQRVKAVRDFRLASKSAGTRKLADKPTRFHVENFPTGNYLLIPSVSSENRQYIPIGFMSPNEIASNLVFVVPNATLYHFGILTSSIHMAWLRTVGGRLESRYRYSKDVVYNNFVWGEPTDKQRQAVEQSAQRILDVRANYPDATFAELYDEVTMPYDLRQAHRANDRAVASAYGFENILNDEPAIAVELLKLHKERS